MGGTVNDRPTRLAFLLAAALGAACFAAAAPPALPNGGFEEAAGAGAASWGLEGALPAGASVSRDVSVRNAGAASLKLSA